MNNLRRAFTLRILSGLLMISLLAGCSGMQRLTFAPTATSTAPLAIIAQQAAGPSKMVYLPVVSRAPNVPVLPPGKVPMEGGHTLPRSTYSYYMMSIDPSANFNLGCELGLSDLNTPGIQDSLVLLDYGSPKKVNGVLGASLLLISGFASTAQIAVAAENFGWGYYVCSGDDMQSHLRIGIGTTNFATSSNPAVTFEHGQAWAGMVNDVGAWLALKTTNSIMQQVDVVGANDIELSWNYYANSRDWLDGYDSANGYALYNFGALPGCPWLARPGSQCGSYPYVWSKEQVWYVIYGAPPVYSLPEIYRVDGINAEQWYLMSVYAYETHGAPVGFVGALSTYTACLQAGGCGTGSGAINNTPKQSWTQLYNLLNGDVRTAQGLRWVSDMAWTNKSGTVDPFSVPFAAAASAAPETVEADTLAMQKDFYLVEALRAELDNPLLSAEARRSLEEKMALALPSPALVTPVEKELPLAAQSAAVFEPLPTEEALVEGSEGLVQPAIASIANTWGGPVGENYVQVLAGAFTESPDQGMLMVITLRPGSAQAERQTIYAPSYTGQLRILERQEDELVIQAANGQIFRFNLDTLQLH